MMESLQKRFERYLIDNHKETLENLILQRIEEAKNLPYYNSTVHSQGDWSTLSIKKKQDRKSVMFVVRITKLFNVSPTKEGLVYLVANIIILPLGVLSTKKLTK